MTLSATDFLAGMVIGGIIVALVATQTGKEISTSLAKAAGGAAKAGAQRLERKATALQVQT